MTPLKVVLFDLDGTLVKAGGSGRLALNRAVKDLYGVEGVCSRFSLAGRTDRNNFLLALKAVKRRPTPPELARLEALYLRYLPQEVRRAVRERRYSPIRGIGTLLRRLARRRGVMLGLGTGNVERGARIKLEPSGLHRFFAFGGFGGDGMSRLAMLRRAVRRAESLARRRVRPQDVYVIGDTPLDVKAGRAGSYRTGAVLCGFGDAEALRRSRPELLAEDFRDAKAWLEWISRPSGRAPAASRRA